MITTETPRTWRELQDESARILEECGFQVEVERVVETARGSVEVDVYAEETVDGRRYSIVCECKHWRSRIPQTVVHGVRTVVTDLGANLGLIIATSDFQAGATPAASFTNVRLVTWADFQSEFETTWLKRHLAPYVADRCGPLLTFCEPFLPAWFEEISGEQKDAYLTLKRRYDGFGWLMMKFTPYVRTLQWVSFPDLPLRPHVAPLAAEYVIPDAILDARGYREFLDAAVAHSDDVIGQFRALRPLNWTPGR